MKKWRLLAATDSFEKYRKDWDALNVARYNHPLLDSRFVAPLLRHFGNPKVMLALSGESEYSAMALVVPVGVGMWQTFQPSQAPIGLINLRQSDDASEELQGLLRSLPGYTLQLGILQQDPDYSSIPAAPGQKALEVVEYIPTARLRLEGTFEDYWKSRSSNLRHNLRRQAKRLEEQGRKLELVAARDPGAMREMVRAHGELERQGWKAGEGTAISENNPQGSFYAEVLESFSAAGEGLAFQLRLAGDIIASELCLLRGGMLIALKTAYDEKIEKLSPGLLLHAEIFRSLFPSMEVQVVEFYGRVMDWHLKFTDEVRTMVHVNCWRAPWMAKVHHSLKRRP